MAKSSKVVQVGKRRIELTNLDKVLWPRDGIVKAELIHYYLSIAPTILAHIKGRPLSLVRFPDGIDGETFFQKNLPHWTPEWIEQVPIGDAEKTIRYMVASDEASMVWLANLAAIELHQMHCRVRSRDTPDYFVFDIDPPEGTPWDLIVQTAIELRADIQKCNYHPFVKTTGRKGLHIVVPIEPAYDFDAVFEASKQIATPFVRSHADTCTLKIQKQARDGRILIDIFRNRPSQTIVAAYSARGLDGATVSMPLDWDQLERSTGIRDFHIHNVPDIVRADGDRWEAIGAYAVELHTMRRRTPTKSEHPRSAKYKTPEQLEKYTGKRSFSKTPEPVPGTLRESGSDFVVHRHHASRLHYDLRLERDGALRSWAVPRGLPPRPGIKRLAVQTEDHPIEYLDFEGTIPKGEYGGGNMWVYARGRYEITKEKKDGSVYFRLHSTGLSGEYRMYPTRGSEWLMERVDPPQVDWLVDPIEPMLAQLQKSVPPASDYIFEVKWDGIRALVSLDEGVIRIHSRNQNDITAAFPELSVADEAFLGTAGLFDCEIVCLDEQGRPVFRDVINRMRQTTEGAIARARAKHPAVCYVFDCLYLDGKPLVNEALERRREFMGDAIRPGGSYRVSQAVDEGEELFAAAAAMGLEGIMAKRRGSVYQAGRRSPSWLKIKSRNTIDCVIIGYTEGRGDRSASFGALHLARSERGQLHYVGKVGTGFDDRALQQVLTALRGVAEAQRLMEEKPVDDAISTWLEPKLLCEVQYASLTSAGTLREPVFIRMRPELSIEDIDGEEE